MKALTKARSEPGLWLQDVAEPRLGINDVLVRISRTGICGTDLSIFNWDAWARETIPVPMVVGHEFVGEVVDTGSNVSDFQPGAVVSGEGHVVCGTCRNCLAGRRAGRRDGGRGCQTRRCPVRRGDGCQSLSNGTR